MRASTRVSGSAQPGWIYTRIPHFTDCNASSGVRSFFRYSVSHNIPSLRTGSQLSAISSSAKSRPRCCVLIAYRHVIDGTVEEMAEQLQHFQLTKKLHRTVLN